MGMVYDDATAQSELVILDASDPTAEPVARVHLPAAGPVRLPRQLDQRRRARPRLTNPTDRE